MNLGSLRIALAQFNPSMADFSGNLSRMQKLQAQASEQHVDLLIFPEMATCGYPADDLWLDINFVAESERMLQSLVGSCGPNLKCIIGHPSQGSKTIVLQSDQPLSQQRQYNSATVLSSEGILNTFHKSALPNYGLFDEQRYFLRSANTNLIRCKETMLGILICEDIWEPEAIQRSMEAGAQAIIVINASPYHVTKLEQRIQLLKTRAQKHQTFIFYVNLWGGQDEFLFDGQSLVISPTGELIAQAHPFADELLILDFDTSTHQCIPVNAPTDLPNDPLEILYQGLVTSVRDYWNKNKIPGAILGLSGGIDSALVACIATDALGADRVQALMLPSRFTAEMSIQDATQLAERLGIRYDCISIEPMYQAFIHHLQSYWNDESIDITLQNAQARIRAQILLAFANTFKQVVLVTSNKSELAVGYTTIYGDMAGGFAVLKDVKKTWVYALARYLNRNEERIPARIITRAPSAELAANQTDQDSLPPYDILDQIIEACVEQTITLEECRARGIAPETIQRVLVMMQRAEHKRRQCAPGPRVTQRGFGRDWRMPITRQLL